MNNRQVLKYHSWFGLIAGVFLLLMGVSGAILVFQHDIEDQLWEDYTNINAEGSLDFDSAIRSIQKTYPGWDTRLIHFEENEAFIFNLRKPTERLFVFVNPSSGEIIKELNELTQFTRWLLKFHYSFQAGVFGRVLVFVVGILFLLSLLTGFYVYRKSILKTFFFKTKITRNKKRSLYSSLHRNVGVWALFFNLLLVITGIFLAYKVAAAGFKDPVSAATPTIGASVNRILKDVKTQHPDFTPTYLRLPLSSGAPLKVYGKFKDDAFFYSEFYNSLNFHAQTGEKLSVTRVQEASLSDKLSSTLIPLHFGQFGGFWSKVIYCLTGLSGPFLSVTGFLLWKIRKNR